MEAENQSVAESTTVESTSTQVESAPSNSSEQSSAEPAEYTPNYKVKAYDNEYEIPETFRSYINKDNEKNFREVFEKAFAIDHMKTKLEKTRSENESLGQYKSNYENINKNLAKASKYVEKGDFGSLFNFLQIPEQNIQQWMYDKLKRGDLPPEAQQIAQKNDEYLQKQYELESQNEAFRQELEGVKEQQTQFAIAKRTQELDSVINRPEINSVVKNFDAKLGQDGAFKNEVIRYAAFEAQNTGRDLSAEEAVNEVYKRIAWNQNSVSDSNGDKVLPPQAGQKKPTLPSMQGKATSPVTQKIKNLDDLKNLRKQMINIENN